MGSLGRETAHLEAEPLAGQELSARGWLGPRPPFPPLLPPGLKAGLNKGSGCPVGLSLFFPFHGQQAFQSPASPLFRI